MKKASLVLLLVLFAIGAALAQRTVKGTITDMEGEPLIGASILVKGTSTGTITDFDGAYSLNIPDGSKMLVVSYTGFNTKEVEIGTASTIDISLEEGITLNEAVVTALGVKRDKKSLGYATQEVDGEEVSRVKDANFINSLSGKVAGVDIKRSNTLGGSSNVIIRGYTSLTGNNQALFVVDGIVISNAITNTTNQETGRGGYDFGNAAMDINPEDIESVNVLKGAAATALYGSRAANGVVLISTKRGAKGKGLGVTVNSGYTLGTIDESTFIRYQKEYGPGYSAVNGFYANGGLEYFDFNGDGIDEDVSPVYEDASFGERLDANRMVGDWRSFYKEWDKYEYGQLFPFVAGANDATYFYETSKTFNTSVAIDGGGENSQYRLSYTYFDMDGILPNSNINKNTVSFSGGYDLTKKLTVSSSVNYVYTEGTGRYGTGYDNRNPNQSFRQWYQVTTDFADLEAAYLDTKKNISWNPYGPLDPARAQVPHYFDNQFFNAYENFSTDNRSRIFGNIELKYELTDWLNITGRVSTDRYSEVQEERIAIGSVDVSKYERYNRSFYENNFDLFASVNKDLGDKFNIGGMVGTNIRKSLVESIRAKTNGGLVSDRVYSLSNSVSGIEAPVEYYAPVEVHGYYARASFGYDRFLYLDLTGRYDISSTLPASDNKYFYPSASLSFVFSELINSNVLDFGKLRLNYAEVGNDAPPLSIFDNYVAGTPYNGSAVASFPSTRNNANLKPESTESIEAGLELSFLQRRLGLDLSLYESNTFDQIIPVTVTGATGDLRRYVNAGQIQNRGVELSLNLGIVKSPAFNWDMRVNWSTNKSEVIELFGDQTNLQLASLQGGITINATVGEAYGTIRGTNFIYDDGGSPIVYPNPFGGVRYRKTAAPEVIGDINPDWRGGVNNRFSYKNLALSFLIDIQKGGDFFSLDTWYGYATGLYDISAGLNRDGVPVRDLPGDGGGTYIDGAVVQTGTDENGVAISDGTPNTEAFYTSDVYSSLGYVYAPNALHVYDASYVKLRELSLTYSLPKSIIDKTPFQGLDISLIGRNLWIISKNTEYSDPESGLSAGNVQGYQSGVYPSVKEYGFNIRVQF
ncbi:MAG: SusC/RagA family TonB-linked outer membrane protein [Saprospiraceae bacterium]|nr:MAG: SusC/RagA family TonB-linked outer membrane protein [Saprospiraceae bacterium]